MTEHRPTESPPPCVCNQGETVKGTVEKPRPVHKHAPMTEHRPTVDERKRCSLCGEPMHRYGFPADGLAGGGRSHKPTATACVNGLRSRASRAEAELEKQQKKNASTTRLRQQRDNAELEVATLLAELEKREAVVEAARSAVHNYNAPGAFNPVVHALAALEGTEGTP